MRQLQLLPLLLMLLPTMALARQSAQGDCVLGGKVVVTNGLNSTTKVMASYPSCTVTVSIQGGGLATIYSDNAGTVLANPFTATTAGHWQWYADNGHYSVLISGGTPQAMPSSFTYSDILLNDQSQLATFVCGLSFASSITFAAASCSDFTLTLTGNVTSSTITGGVVGQQIAVSLCQDATGSRTFAWPPSFTRPPTISSAAGICTNAIFFFDGINWRQLGATGDALVASGGSLTGTYTGNPTFSGNPIFSGNVSYSGTAPITTVGDNPVVFGGSLSALRMSAFRYCDRFASLQACHDDLPAGGGTMIASAATYSGAAGTLLTISKPNVVLQGAGRATIITVPTSGLCCNAVVPIIQVSAANVRITNLQIQGQSVDATTAQYGIQVSGAGTALEVDHVTFAGTDSTHGLNSAISLGSGTASNNVHDNTIGLLYGTGSTSTGYGVILVAANNSKVHHNSCTFNSTWGRHCVYLSQNSQGNEVASNWVTGGVQADIALYALDAQGTGCQNNDVHDNILLSNTATAGAMISVSNQCTNNKIHDNLINGSTTAIGIIVADAGGTKTPDHNQIQNNTIVGVGNECLLVLGAQNNLIQGNKLLNCSQAANQSYDALKIAGDAGVSAANNRVKGNFVTGSSNRYSFEITGSPAPAATEVYDNTFDNGGFTGINDAGTGTLYGLNSIGGVSKINSGLAITGALTGVTSLTIAGALAGVTTESLSGQLTSTLATGTAPLVIASTTRVANLGTGTHAFVYDCGSTTTCSATQLINPQWLKGVVTLAAGTATVTALPAFTSTANFNCTCEDTTTASNSCRVVPASTTSITATGIGTDILAYQCGGN